MQQYLQGGSPARNEDLRRILCNSRLRCLVFMSLRKAARGYNSETRTLRGGTWRTGCDVGRVVEPKTWCTQPGKRARRRIYSSRVKSRLRLVVCGGMWQVGHNGVSGLVRARVEMTSTVVKSSHVFFFNSLYYSGEYMNHVRHPRCVIKLAEEASGSNAACRHNLISSWQRDRYIKNNNNAQYRTTVFWALR